MNLAMFSVSRLRLETMGRSGNQQAQRILALRRNANFTLATILWGNVGINVLLTLLADSIMAGLTAFAFSTVIITFLGEIIPQAYFSRHALQIASLLSPALRFYQLALGPVAWTTGKLLDSWIGPEGIPWYRESELRAMLREHARDTTTEISRVEALGAMNFLSLDDIPVDLEGEVLDEQSIIQLPHEHGKPVWPAWSRQPEDTFLQSLNRAGHKWVVLTDIAGEPQFVLDADAFIRDAFFGGDSFRPLSHCHRPVMVREGDLPLGRVLGRLTVQPESISDDVVDKDLILVWTPSEKRIITGADILGRLLRGITSRKPSGVS
jgi:hypothetical protein